MHGPYRFIALIKYWFIALIKYRIVSSSCDEIYIKMYDLSRSFISETLFSDIAFPFNCLSYQSQNFNCFILLLVDVLKTSLGPVVQNKRCC